MGIFDTFIVYKFIRLLTTPWDMTPAFKLGIIDGSGYRIKTKILKTDAEQDAYSLFNRLVFNIKRLIEKIPGGKSKIGTYAAAFFLFREQMGDEQGVLIFERAFMTYLKDHNALAPNYLAEQYLPEELLPQGNYRLTNDMLDTKGNSIPKGTVVVSKANLKPTRILGVDVFQVQVAHTGKLVVVSTDDIIEV